MSVIEDSLLKNGSLISVNNNIDKSNSFEDFHAFLKSNRMPLQNIEDTQLFETNLCDPEFRKVAVRADSNLIVPTLSSSFSHFS